MIPNSVTSIGAGAFQFCSGLIAVTIPNSVTSIGVSAFAYCSGLTSVTIGNSVTSIGSHAFRFCSGLIAVTIGNLVTSIGESAFNGCSGLTSVTIPNSVTSIGILAFAYCSGLIAVTIPNSVTSIGDHAFNGCSGLTSVTIPNSVTNIGDYAFTSCTALTSLLCDIETPLSINPNVFEGVNQGACSLTVPNGSVSAYTAAFVWKDFAPITYCATLTKNTTTVTACGSYDWANNGQTYTESGAYTGTTTNCVMEKLVLTILPAQTNFSSGGLNYVVTSATTVAVGNNSGAIGPIIIPASVTTECGTYGVTSIDQYAFTNSSGLTSVTIPNSVTSIGAGAFYDCSGLTSVTIPTSVNSIGNNAFGSCSGLTSVTIPNSVTSIGIFAFAYCTGLTSVIIPNSVNSIGDYAFSGCSGLTSVVCEIETPLSINPNVFGFNQSTCSLTVPNGSVSAYAGALVWQNFAPITCAIPSENTTTVTACNSYTWANNNQTYTASGTYTGTTTNCVTEKLVLTILSTATDQTNFSSGGLNYVVTSATTVAVGENSGASGPIIIPASVSNACFNYTVTSIGPLAFNGCSGLTSVTIPNSVTSIGDYAFLYCSGLTSVVCDIATPLSINSTIFEEVIQSNCSLTVPSSSVDAYAAALVWQNFAPITCATPTENITTVSACGSYAWANNNQSYTASGTYTGTTTNCVTEKLVLTITTATDQTNFSSGGLNYVVTSATTVAVGENSGASGPIIIPASVSNACFNYTVTSIGPLAFNGCSGLTSVTIPNSVTSIGDYAFLYCSGLTSVVCEIATPLSINSTIFEEVIQSNCSLTVPNSSVDAYAAALVWQNFAPITCATPTENTTTVTACNSYTWNGIVFTTSGIKTGITTNCVTEKLDLTITTATAVPALPGVISGPVTIAPNTTKTYTIASVANATSYAWTIPANATLVSGQGTASATFDFGLGYTTGSITVKATNCKGNSATRSLTVKKVGVSAVRATQCDKTLAAINTTIYANTITGATKYRFEVSNGGTSQSFETTNYYFNLTQLTVKPNYNTAYSIRVAVLFDNVWQDYGAACTVTTPVAPLTTKVKVTQCGQTLAFINSTLSADVVVNANKYQFEISKNDIVVQELTSDLYYTRLTNLVVGAEYGTTYSIRVRYSFDTGTTWSDYGTSCMVSTPAIPLTTKVRATQCGQTLAFINSTIYADWVGYANKYQFEIRKNDIVVQELTSDLYYTRLTNLVVGAEYGTTYSIRVRYSFDTGTTWSDYGASCTVATPAAPLTTKVKATQCGQTLSLINSTLSADVITYANKYQFEISKDNAVIQELTSSLYYTRLTNLTATAQYGTTYDVRVRYSFDNGTTWSDYGASCTVTTPAAPLTTKVRTTQCGTTLALINSTLSADVITYANKYQFEISKDNAVIQELTSSLYYTRLTNLTAGLQNGTTYSVRVRYSFDNGSTWSAYGMPCNVNTPAAQGFVIAAMNSPEATIAVYPNPYTSTFKLATSFEGAVNVRIIDITGKLIEQFDVDAAELATKEMGEMYVPGMYQVTVSQATQVKNFKVVKSN